MATRYPMKVIPFDSLTRVHVTSQTDPSREPYLVDLLEYNRNGKCSCMGFLTQHQKALEAMPPTFCDWEGDFHRCKHLKLVRAVLGLQLLESLLEIEHAKETTLTVQADVVAWYQTKSPVDPGPPTESKSEEEAPPTPQQGDGETDEGIPEAAPGIPGSSSALLCVPTSEREEGD